MKTFMRWFDIVAKFCILYLGAKIATPFVVATFSAGIDLETRLEALAASLCMVVFINAHIRCWLMDSMRDRQKLEQAEGEPS